MEIVIDEKRIFELVQPIWEELEEAHKDLLCGKYCNNNYENALTKYYLIVDTCGALNVRIYIKDNALKFCYLKNGEVINNSYDLEKTSEYLFDDEDREIEDF